jgi:hypothetical protein
MSARRPDPMDNGFEYVLYSKTRLGTGEDRLTRRDGQNIFQLFFDRRNVGVWKIDLVNHGDDRQVLFHGEMHIRHRLGFYALRRVNHQDGPFAGRQAS